MEALTFGRFQKRQHFGWASQYLVSGVEEGKGVQAEKGAQVGSMWTRSHALGRAVGSFQPGHLGTGAPPRVGGTLEGPFFVCLLINPHDCFEIHPCSLSWYAK